jgi:lipoprotein-releasing system permease protein
LNLPFFIARRYVLAKKSHNAINLIAAISILGITGGTIAFIIVLSVFNGFESVVQGLFNSFYADLEIIPKIGKTFVPNEDNINKIRQLHGVLDIGKILEDNALLIYGDKQTIGMVRGVDSCYANITSLDTMMIEGKYTLLENKTPYAIVGRGIKYFLNIDAQFFDNLNLVVPRRDIKISLDPNRALTSKLIRPSGTFASQPELDTKYVIVPLSFARSLYGYTNEISALEIKLKPDISLSQIQNKIQHIVGDEFRVKNRFQQNELLYKTMKTEKWAIFFILVFILLVASFNVVGTLTMLIIEKKNDIQTLRRMGSKMKSIKTTFLYEGLMISMIGAILGLLLGSFICYLQQRYGFVKLPGNGSFVINNYPVKLIFTDIIVVLITVTAIGFFAAWFPVRILTKKYLLSEN